MSEDADECRGTSDALESQADDSELEEGGQSDLGNIVENITGGEASKRTEAQLRADLAAIDLEGLEVKGSEVEHRPATCC